MLTRSITLAGSPNVQVTLYFKSRSNAEKTFEKTSIEGERALTDDYMQNIVIGSDAKIISDVITDVKQMLAASAEMEVVKLHASKKLQERVDSDPLLKMWLETQRRGQQPRGGMQPPILNPGGMPAANG